MLLPRLLLLAAGLSIATTASAQWAIQRAPAGLYSLTDVHFTDADHGYASAAIGGLMKTDDGGQSWRSIPTGVMSSLRDVHFATPDSGYVVGNAGVIIRTTNGGQSWQRRDLANAGSSVNGVYAHRGQRALVTQGTDIYQTTDGGASWNVVYSYNGPLNIFVFRFLEFADANVGYAVGGFSSSFGNVSQVVKTVDGGRTWTLLPSLAGSAPMGGAAAVAFPDAQTGYVADVQRRLFRTTDGGQTWTIVAPGTFDGYQALHFTSALTGYAVGVGKMGMTTDGGLSWVDQSLSSTDNFAAVYFPTPQVGYAAGSDGAATARVARYTAQSSATRRPGALARISVYPNPARETLWLQDLPAGPATEVSLYALDGRRVRQLSLGGGSPQALSTAGLAAGVYVLQLRRGDEQHQQKLVLE